MGGPAEGAVGELGEEFGGGDVVGHGDPLSSGGLGLTLAHGGDSVCPGGWSGGGGGEDEEFHEAADLAVFGDGAGVGGEALGDGVGVLGEPVAGEGEGVEHLEPGTGGGPPEFALDLLDDDVLEVGEEGDLGEAAMVVAVVDLGVVGVFAADGGEEAVPGLAEEGAGGDGGGDGSAGFCEAGGFAEESDGFIGVGEDEVEGDGVGGLVREVDGDGVVVDEAEGEVCVAEAGAGGFDLGAGEVDADDLSAGECVSGGGDDGACAAAEVDQEGIGAELEAFDDELGGGIEEGGLEIGGGEGGAVEAALGFGVVHVVSGGTLGAVLG